MKQKDLLFILVPTLIMTVLWVIFSIYHNYVTSTIKEPLTFQIIPIEGSFDTQTIDNTKRRGQINPLYEIDAVPVAPSEADISSTDTQNPSTPSAEPTP